MRGVMVLAGGLLAGTFDLVYACLFWAIKAGAPPRRILQSSAAGLLGRASFQGGNRTALLGLGLHFFIALSMSLVFFLAARRRPLLRDRPVPSGIVYGLLAYFGMNLVVLPLSAVGPAVKDPLWIGLTILVHMFLIGLPIALCTRRAYQIA